MVPDLVCLMVGSNHPHGQLSQIYSVTYNPLCNTPFMYSNFLSTSMYCDSVCNILYGCERFPFPGSPLKDYILLRIGFSDIACIYTDTHYSARHVSCM